MAQFVYLTEWGRELSVAREWGRSSSGVMVWSLIWLVLFPLEVFIADLFADKSVFLPIAEGS